MIVNYVSSSVKQGEEPGSIRSTTYPAWEPTVSIVITKGGSARCATWKKLIRLLDGFMPRHFICLTIDRYEATAINVLIHLSAVKWPWHTSSSDIGVIEMMQTTCFTYRGRLEHKGRQHCHMMSRKVKNCSDVRWRVNYRIASLKR